MKIKNLVIGLLMLLFILSLHGKANAYDNEKTHRSILERALSLNSYLDSCLRNHYGFTEGINANIDSQNDPVEDERPDDKVREIRRWLQYGSYMEDEPICRANRHFLNPLKEWPDAYVDDMPRTSAELSPQNRSKVILRIRADLTKEDRSIYCALML